MHVCDVDHVSPVAHTYIITRTPPDRGAPHDSDTEPIVLELSEKASAALEQKDWAALAALVPDNGRSKNPARVAGAKKGAQTRAARRTELSRGERPDLQAHAAANNAMSGFAPGDD